MKLLCKKTWWYSYNKRRPYNCLALTPGKYYTFEKTMGAICIFYKLFNDDNGDFWYFSDIPGGLYYTWDFFYTPQQTRKMKLQKLNEITLQEKSR